MGVAFRLPRELFVLPSALTIYRADWVEVKVAYPSTDCHVGPY
jgi:hypothetical protein